MTAPRPSDDARGEWVKWEPTRRDKALAYVLDAVIALMSPDTRDVIRQGIFREGIDRSRPPRRSMDIPPSPRHTPPAEGAR